MLTGIANVIGSKNYGMHIAQVCAHVHASLSLRVHKFKDKVIANSEVRISSAVQQALEFLCDCSDHTAMKLALSSVLPHPYLRHLSQNMVLADITLEHSENNITRAPLASSNTQG